MGKLGDVLGDDFEEEYEQKRQSRQEEASKVEKELLMEICYEAIEGGGFKGEEPRFRFDGPNLDHDVLLMESPERDLQKFRHQLGEDAMSLGMFHMNQLFSCAFQEHMLDLLDKIEEDEYYLVVGRYQEKKEETGAGETNTYYNINPVRGIVPIEVAKQYAEKYKESMEGTSIEEQAQEQQSSTSSDTSSSSEVTDSDVISVFEGIADKAPQVLEQVAEGDDDMIDKLVNVTNDNLSSETDREHILDVFEQEIEEIPGRGEDEEDDDDDLDLGGLGGGSDSSDDEDEEEVEDGPEEEEDESETEETDSSDDDSGGSEVEDWF